jgi:hypothetical protein
MKASLGKTKATIKAGQEQMRIEMKTGVEEMKATESDASQEKIETIVEHSDGALHVKATCMLTSCRARLPVLYMEALKEQHKRKLLEQLMIDSGTNSLP